MLPRVSPSRLMGRLEELASVGAIEGGGSCRLALTDADRAGRDLVVAWMRDLGLRVDIDGVGNVSGVWDVGQGSPVMTGSHIDTVRTGGRYDGNYGVLAGLEVIETLMLSGATPPTSARGGLLHQRRGGSIPTRHARLPRPRRGHVARERSRHGRHRRCPTG